MTVKASASPARTTRRGIITARAAAAKLSRRLGPKAAAFKKTITTEVLKSRGRGAVMFKLSIPTVHRWAPDRESLARVLVNQAAAHVAALPAHAVAATLQQVMNAVQVDFVIPNPAPASRSRRSASAEASAGRGPNQAALERGFARADTNRAEMLKRPDMLTGEQVAERLGLSRATVDNRRVAGKLLALEVGAKRGVRYPDWQCGLVRETSARTAFENALEALGKTERWSKYRFFTQIAPVLGGRSPVEALRAGDTDAVVSAAESWAVAEQGGG